MCDDDYYGHAFQTRRWVKARKAHRCSAVDCDINIRPGDLYHEFSVCTERGDRPERYRHCARCWAICEALWKDGAHAIDLELDCGETWESAERSGPEPGHLAFMTADDAQRMLTPQPSAAHST